MANTKDFYGFFTLYSKHTLTHCNYRNNSTRFLKVTDANLSPLSSTLAKNYIAAFYCVFTSAWICPGRPRLCSNSVVYSLLGVSVNIVAFTSQIEYLDRKHFVALVKEGRFNNNTVLAHLDKQIRSSYHLLKPHTAAVADIKCPSYQSVRPERQQPNSSYAWKFRSRMSYPFTPYTGKTLRRTLKLECKGKITNKAKIEKFFERTFWDIHDSDGAHHTPYGPL